MVDIASLAIEIDTSDVARAEADLDRLSGKGAKAEQAAEKIGGAFSDAAQKVGSVGGAAASVGNALDTLGTKTSEAASAARGVGDAYGKTASGMAGVSGAATTAGNALSKSAQAMQLAGLSAGQYNQAMRMLPMQLTDVATSLASGMPLWMVAIQQGGQVKDSFGGIGNAARGIVASINPMTAGLAVAGGALAGIAAAYYEGAQESARFNEALILTGGYAGKTAAQMADMAIKMDALGGVTQGSAAEALAQVAATGKIAGDQLEMVATAAEQMRVATGKSIEETIAEFVKIGESPVSALLDLNDKYHLLTQAQLEQIQTLKEQGKLEEAAAEGMRVYADTIADRAPKTVENLGWIERKWRDLKDAMRETWDGAASLGRAPGQDQQIKALNERIAYLKSTVGTGYEPLADTTGEIAKLEAQLASLTTTKAAAKTVDSGLAKAGQQYLDSLKAQSIQIQDLSFHEQALQKIKTLGIDASTAQGRQIIAEADTLDQLKAKKEADTKAEREAEQAKRKMATATEAATKRLNEYLGQSSVSATAAEAMAKAYFYGASSVRELTIQQKIEQELLKTGVGARDAVTAAVNRQQNALDRLDLGKRYADLKLDTDQLHAQAIATLGGVDALQEYNAQKLLASALAGKNAEALGAESQQLLEQIRLNQEAAKSVELASRANNIMDRLYPQQKLLRDYTEDQKALGEAMANDKEHADQWRAALERLGTEYEANKRATTAWGQWTVSALERVDSAFADAWKNIGGGFKSFRTSLTDAFRQMLAELAHMAITKPIVLSIGAALGIGGSQQALANGGSGIWGMLSGSGSSAGGFGSLLSYGQSAYNVLTGVGPAALAGYQSGGVMGGLSGIGSYYGNMLSNAYSSVAGWFGAGSSAAASSAAASAGSTGFGYGSSLVNGGIGSASYAGSAASSASSLSSSLSTVGTGLAAVGSALAIYNSYQQQGVKGALVTGGATALGAVFGGPIGAALGAAVGNFVSGKLFGSGWQTTDSGIAVRARDGQFQGWNYQHQEKSGGWLSSSGSKYSYSAMNQELKDQLSKRFGSVVESVPPLFEKLGFDVASNALDGLNVGMRNIALSGSAAQQQKQLEKGITAWFGRVGNVASEDIGQTLIAEMASKIQGAAASEIQAIADSYGLGAVDTQQLAGLSGGRLTKALQDITGFGKNAYQTLTDLVGTLDSVNATFETLDLTLYDGSLAGARMAENMVTLAGGMDAFQKATATYYDKFFSASEKAQDSVQAVIRQFSASDVVLPATREQYRALVESIDTSTESGRQLVNTLMQLAGAADTAYSAFDTLKSSGDAAVSAAQQSVISAYQSESSALQATINKFDQFAASLGDFRDQLSLTILGASSTGDQLDTLRRKFADTAALAKLGNEQALGDLPTIGSNLATAAQSYSASREDYIRELARIGQASADAQATASRQSSIAQQQLDAMTAQLDALGLINDSVQSLADALTELTDAQSSTRSDQIDFIAGMIAKGFEALQPTQVVSALGVGFDALDANTNGLLTQTELSDALKGKASDAQIQSLQYVVDSNLDGLISATELNAAAGMTQAQALTAGLAGIQQAIGSAITLAQAQSGLGGIASGSSIANQFGALDTNKDGTLSKAEINGTAPAQQSVTYGRLDALKAAAALGISTAGGSTAAGIKRIAEEMAAATGNQVTINSPTLGKVSAFAAGGYHSGGLRLVGERGPELEVTGPSRIYNASQTADMLGGAASTATEIRALRDEVQSLRSALIAIARHTEKTAHNVEQLNEVGVQMIQGVA